MQDLLNILQHIKDQAEPTLTQSVYERHPLMLITELAAGILFVALIITLIMSVLGKWDDVPVEVYFGVGLVIAIAMHMHRSYQYEMTKDSEQRVNDVLKATPADEYAELTKQIKLADLDQIDDVTLRAIAKHVKNIESPGLFK